MVCVMVIADLAKCYLTKDVCANNEIILLINLLLVHDVVTE
jgi:hypothetical protein